MLRRDEATNTSSMREKCFLGERIVMRKYLLLVEFYRRFLTITKLRGHLWKKLGRLKIITLRTQLLINDDSRHYSIKKQMFVMLTKY